MLKPSNIRVEDLGDRAELIPGPEPELQPPPKTCGWEKPIPVSAPSLDGNELAYVTRCIETNWISSIGSYVDEFEKRFSACCGAEHGIATTSGTTALHLAVAAYGIGPGDEVIMPTFTMIATANTVAYTGAKPVLVDSEPRTWNMDCDQVRDRITPRTKAIMVMHTYGHPVDMDRINAIAEEHDLIVIEDAAEAHGAEYHERRIGSLGHCACFSFYGNKIITTGEGGMITTNDADYAALARNMRDHSFSEERHFWHRLRGFNYRMTNLQAAIGVAQVERFDHLVQKRIDHAMRYNELLRDVPGITLPPATDGVRNVYWMYGILVGEEFGMSRDELRVSLASQGIETRTFFVPVHLQPVYFPDHGHERHPVSEELCKRGMYLPSSADLTDEQIEFVCRSIKMAHEAGPQSSS